MPKQRTLPDIPYTARQSPQRLWRPYLPCRLYHAFRLGYYDPYHFSKAFHSEMELTPKEYHKRYMDKKIGEIGE